MLRRFALVVMAISAYLVSSSSAAESICSLSDLPAGKIIELVTPTGCGMANTQPKYQVGNPSRGKSICAPGGYPMPSGYYVDDVTRTQSNCNGGKSYTLDEVGREGNACLGTPFSGSFPVGMAVTSITLTGGVTGSTACYDQNDYYVKVPNSNGFWACEFGYGSLVGQFVVTQVGYQSTCKTSFNQTGDNAIYIKSPEENDKVCLSKTTIPDGWVVTGSGTNSSCDGQYATINQTEDHGLMCGAGSPPDGFVVVGIETATQCASGHASRLRDLSELSSGSAVCKFHNPMSLGSNFVVTEVLGNQSQCVNLGVGSNTGYRFTKLTASSGSVDACQISGVPNPDGYAFGPTYMEADCGASTASGSARTLTPLNENGTHICASGGYTIPDGWVITNISSYASGVCPTSFGQYELTIATASENSLQSVCNHFGAKVPSTHVVKENNGASQTQCAGFNMIKIEKPDDYEQVCGGFSWPSGYIWTNTSANSSSCTASAGGQLLTIQLPQAGNQYAVCSTDDLLAGWVVVQIGSGHCPVGSTYTIADIGHTDTMCYVGDPIPVGYVIKGFTSGDGCGSGNRLRISLPADGSESVCYNSTNAPLPTGYEIVGTNTYFSCPAGFSGRVIRPISLPNGSVVPSAPSSWSLPSVPDGYQRSLNYDCNDSELGGGMLSGGSQNSVSCGDQL